MWIKICGCRLPEDAAAAAEAGAAAVGMILTPGFRRSLAPSAARVLRDAVPAGLWSVGVFVDEPVAAVAAVAAELRLDAVQLHGGEDEADCAALRARGRRIIRRWDGTGPAPRAADIVHVESAGAAGGLGQAWEWGLAAGAGERAGVPAVLAGGLTPENVWQACDAAHPWGVDVSSGVETGGKKDPERIAAFCAAVRAWERRRCEGTG